MGKMSAAAKKRSVDIAKIVALVLSVPIISIGGMIYYAGKRDNIVTNTKNTQDRIVPIVERLDKDTAVLKEATEIKLQKVHDEITDVKAEIRDVKSEVKDIQKYLREWREEWKGGK
jgi:peptidoglycan hydrolase CwlO-like protein